MCLTYKDCNVSMQFRHSIFQGKNTTSINLVCISMGVRLLKFQVFKISVRRRIKHLLKTCNELCDICIIA